MRASAARLGHHGRACLVTGADRGIGLAAVCELAARGAGYVVRVGLPAVSSAQLAQAWTTGRLPSRPMSPSRRDNECDQDRVRALRLARCRGGDRRTASIGTVRTRPAEEFEWVIEVNLLGVYRTVRPVIESVAGRRAHLLAVSPAAATVAWRESAGRVAPGQLRAVAAGLAARRGL